MKLVLHQKTSDNLPISVRNIEVSAIIKYHSAVVAGLSAKLKIRRIRKTKLSVYCVFTNIPI